MVIETENFTETKKRDLICNMRAPDLPHFDRWHVWTAWCKENGHDVCHLTLSITDAFMKGPQEVATIRDGQQIIQIKMENQFLYQVKKPRRIPHSLSCVRPEFRRTFSSILYEGYMLNKAREINREFCFRDFLEFKHDAFRRIVLRLRRKGKIMAHPQRTCPTFYFLTEKLAEENAKSEQLCKTDVYISGGLGGG